MNPDQSQRKIERLRNSLNKVPHWLLSGICLVVILWLTLSPDPLGGTDLPLFPGADKVVHGLMFFGLTLCMLIDLKRARGWQRLHLPQLSSVTLISMLIGIGIECMQPLMGRSFEFLDMGADAFGAVLAGALWTLADGVFTTDDELREGHFDEEPARTDEKGEMKKGNNG